MVNDEELRRIIEERKAQQQLEAERIFKEHERQKALLAQFNGDRIEIRNGQVVVVREQLLAELPADEAFKVLAVASGSTIGLLPRGTAFVNYQPLQAQFLIERSPDILQIKAPFMRRPMRLSMPWQYFLFRFKRNRPNVQGVLWQLEIADLFWSRNRISSLSERGVVIAPLPNIDQSTGSICFGMTIPPSNLPLHERIDNMVDGFYATESEFNGDLGWNMPWEYSKQIYNTLRDAHGAEEVIQSAYQQGYSLWAEDSRTDKTCYMKWSEWSDPPNGFARLDRFMPREEQNDNQPSGMSARDANTQAVSLLRQKGGTTEWR